MDKLIKRLLWLYFFLLVGEGVLRKWIVPSLSEPLLIIRDPVALAIYVVAFMSGRFPLRASILVLGGMALVSIAFGALSGMPPVVALYGLRINYFHVPLVFIMAGLLDRKDLLGYGRAVLWLTLPIGLLMILQFRAGEGSWLNVAAGGSEGQLSGALGKTRPPGPFTFISGPVLWFSLATAFTCYGWIHRGIYSRLLLVPVTCMIVIAVPISISRMLLFSVLVVVVFGAVAILRNPRRGLTLFAPALFIIVTFAIINGGEMTAAFQQRWKTSMTSGVQDSVVTRVSNDYLGSLDLISSAPLFGYGIGMGSNVGARFTNGRMGFQLAESEWAKIILELGPLLGFAFIVYRCWLSSRLLLSGWRSLLVHEDSLPWLLCGACILPVLSGQWAPPTILGFAVFGAGLVLAAARPDITEQPEEDSTVDDAEAETTPEQEPPPTRRPRRA